MHPVPWYFFPYQMPYLQADPTGGLVAPFPMPKSPTRWEVLSPTGIQRKNEVRTPKGYTNPVREKITQELWDLAMGGGKCGLERYLRHHLMGKKITPPKTIAPSPIYPGGPSSSRDTKNVSSALEWIIEGVLFFGCSFKSNPCYHDSFCDHYPTCRNSHRGDPWIIVSHQKFIITHVQFNRFSEKGNHIDQISSIHLQVRRDLTLHRKWESKIEEVLSQMRDDFEKNLALKDHVIPNFCHWEGCFYGKSHFPNCPNSHSFTELMARMIEKHPDLAMTRLCEFELEDCPMGASCIHSHGGEPYRMKTEKGWIWVDPIEQIVPTPHSLQLIKKEEITDLKNERLHEPCHGK